MDRFGSSLFRIVWACAFLLLAGLVLGGIQGFGGDGSQLVIFGTGIPLGMQDTKPYVTDALARLIYTIVPAVILLGGYLPVADRAAASAKGERFKGLFLGLGLAIVHGLFLSQVAMLPMLAAGYRLLGSPFAPSILQADLNAVILGIQLLLWTVALSMVVKSNRGIAILLAFSLAAVGKLMAWIGEFGLDLEMPKALVKSLAFLGHLFPTESLPREPLAWNALPLSIGGPLLLAILLLLLPGKAAKRSKA
ncbi:MAG: hypothetical protein Q8O00_14015 [Holophaga sp.]|nr:hypothetical protein [Holophaga sp.]